MRRVKITIAGLSVLLIVLVAAIAALLAGGRQGSYASEVADRLAHRGPAAPLTDLGDTAQLRDAFNRDAGTPRLVLLFSPT